MKRNLESTDIVVAIGMIATLFGGYFLYIASYGGALGVQPQKTAAVPLTTAVVERQLQQSINQTVNDQEALSQEFERDVVQAAGFLKKAMSSAGQSSPMTVEDAVAMARSYQETYDGQVQYMLGKTVVNLTKQGMQSGTLSGDNLNNRHNDRIIASTMRQAQMAERAFTNSSQPRMGTWIVSAARQDLRREAALQTRLGLATVQLAKVNHQYESQLNGLRNQHKALLAAAVRTEAQDGRFAQLAKAGDMAAPSSSGTPSHIQKAGLFPELPTEYLIVAFLGLITVFMIALSLPAKTTPTGHVVQSAKPVLRFQKPHKRKAS